MKTKTNFIFFSFYPSGHPSAFNSRLITTFYFKGNSHTILFLTIFVYITPIVNHARAPCSFNSKPFYLYTKQKNETRRFLFFCKIKREYIVPVRMVFLTRALLSYTATGTSSSSSFFFHLACYPYK